MTCDLLDGYILECLFQNWTRLFVEWPDTAFKDLSHSMGSLKEATNSQDEHAVCEVQAGVQRPGELSAGLFPSTEVPGDAASCSPETEQDAPVQASTT